MCSFYAGVCLLCLFLSVNELCRMVPTAYVKHSTESQVISCLIFFCYKIVSNYAFYHLQTELKIKYSDVREL